jgi:ABC-type multidrug transport system ATPase subunit
MQHLIEVRGLSKRFGSFQAVKDLSFSVSAGEVYGFLGQNGAGKSTTLRMLLTLIHPDEGSIRLFGHDLKTHRKEILSRTGGLIERPDVYPYLSAFENLQLFARLSGLRLSRQQLMDQLATVGLAQRAQDKAAVYSQGMKQRLGIAIALVHQPELVILDEPTNGLDPQGIADIRQLIRSLSKEQGKTIVVSSHLLTEIEQVADRLLIIDKGVKKVEGTAAELFSGEQKLVEVTTPGAAQVLNQQLAEMPFPATVVGADKLQFSLTEPDIPLLTAELVKREIPVFGLVTKTKLEDYFLHITGRS